MINLLALITNKQFWKIYSLLIKTILKLYGIKIGTKFYVEGTPSLKIKGKGANVIIGNNVRFLGNIDLRNRENGKIVLHDNVTIEQDCRIVSAREGTIEIGEGSIVCAYTIMNGGSDITIGKQCIIGPRSSINANEHVFKRDTPVRQAGFMHAPVYIEDDSWLATNVVVNKGVRIAKGTIIASNAVVTKDTEPYSIVGGIPAQKIGQRN